MYTSPSIYLSKCRERLAVFSMLVNHVGWVSFVSFMDQRQVCRDGKIEQPGQNEQKRKMRVSVSWVSIPVLFLISPYTCPLCLFNNFLFTILAHPGWLLLLTNKSCCFPFGYAELSFHHLTVWLHPQSSPLCTSPELAAQGSKAERKKATEGSPACVISVVLLASEFFWKLSQAAEKVIF